MEKIDIYKLEKFIKNYNYKKVIERIKSWDEEKFLMKFGRHRLKEL